MGLQLKNEKGKASNSEVAPGKSDNPTSAKASGSLEE
jgi:hypothetical protein